MKPKRKIISLLLCAAMLLSLCPTSVFAEAAAQDSGIAIGASGLCEHHTEHNEGCGYTEGTPESPCNHEHTDECYTLVKNCVHSHTEDCYPQETVSGNVATPSDAGEREPENCAHVCSEESGCIVEELDCQHEHDDQCGYAPATEGTPCGFVCEECNPVDSGGQTETAVTVESVQAMIDALPGEDEISGDNAEEVQAQLAAIDEVMAKLTDEEIAQLDMTRYLEAVAALEGLYEEVATPSNAIMLADYNGPAIVPGTAHLAGGQASNIYYGNYYQSDVNGQIKDPIKWRVLSNADGKLFLLADQNLDVQKYNETKISITWENCTLRTWMNSDFYNAAFSQNEQGYIAETANENANNGNIPGGNQTTDKVFALSIAEANNGAYFPGGDTDRKGTNTVYVGRKKGMNGPNVADLWWLRSPAGDSADNAARISIGGGVVWNLRDVTYATVAVRPAFKLDLTSVLFTSAAVGGKPEGGLQAIKEYTGNEWKLTLEDTARTNSFTASKTDDHTITYSGAETGDNEYISVLIQDNSTKEYTHYGRLKNLTDSSDATGNVTVILPFDMTDKTLYVFNEQCNSDKMTDYASELKPIDLQKNAYTITNNLSNVTTSNTATYRMISDSNAYTANLTADPNYVLLPENIEVKAGTATLTAETDYTYENGTLTIPADKIKGDIEITASGTPATYSISVSGSGTFEERHIGYTAAPDAATFTITNNGNSQVTGLSVPLSVSGFILTQPEKTDLAPNEIATFTVKPDTGLAVGEHKATVNITGDNRAAATVNLSFTVSNHKFTNYVSDGNATCTADGTKTAICDYQGCLVEDTQPETKLGHDYKETVTAPTCTTGGYTTHTCSRCTDSYTDNETDKLGHDFGNWQEITSPTCEGNGQKQRQCSRCSVTETENVNPTGHTWEADYTIDQAATCTADGSKSIHCEKCTVTKDSEVIQKTGHSYTNYTETSDATCTASGTKTAVCDNGCGETDVIADNSKPALGHAGGDATCMAKAVCTRCQQEYGEKDMSNHTGGEEVRDEREATTTAEGYTGDTYCLGCGEKIATGTTIPKKPGGGSSGGDTTPDYYTLTFETNGGSKIDTFRTSSYGKTVDLSDYTPTREGYDFNGWYADKALTEKITSIRLNGNKTVYAGWTKQAAPVDPDDPDKENPSTGGSPFTDVKESDWFYDAVMFVYEKKIMVGTSDTTFSPYGTATRGMMAAIIWRMEGSPKAEYSGTLKDVPKDSYYAEAVKWTMQQGIFNGYGGGLFGPDDPITRQQLAAIFYNYAKYKGYDLTPTDSLSGFTDGDKVSDWAQDAMKWAVGSGLMNGKGDGILDPQGTATRAEIAAMLHRFIEKYQLVEGVAPGGMTGWIDPRRTLSPQTGDNTNITLWAGMFLFSAMALAVTLYTIKRRDNDETPFPT